MSIASRITAIEEHIRDVYDTIDYSYDTTDVDKNIINIPQNIFNGYINVLNDNGQSLWNNLTKVSQADVTEAELSNVVTAPMKIDLKGNISQETTSGKNLWGGFTFSKTNANVDFAYNNNGTISANGTASVNASSMTLAEATTNGYYKTLNAGTYTLSGGISSGKFVRALNTNGDTLATDIGFGASFTISEETQVFIRCVIMSEETSQNEIFYVMLENNSTVTSYEPYTGGQPSPSPDYPQQVKVVKGENVVSVSGKNLFDVTKHTNTLEANTTIISANEYTCNVVTAWRGRVIVPINDFKKNTDYTFSYVSNNPRSIMSRINGVKDGTSTTLVSNYYYQYTNKATINTDEYDQIVVDLFATGNNNTIENTTISNIQFEEGTSITSFVPYSKTDYPINLGDIELCQLLYPIHQLYKTDAILVRKPKWYLQKRVGKVVLNENYGNWSLQSINTYGIANFTMSPNLSNYETRQLSLCISDYFTRQVSLIANTQSEGIYISQAGKLYIRIDSTKASNVSEFLTWLSSHNVTLYYALATPTEEEITNTTLIEQLEAIYKAKSVKDKTYVTQTNDDLPFILDIEAIKEYEVV